MVTNKILWQPNAKQISNSRITQFANHLGLGQSYSELHRFSVENPIHFWSAVWDYCKLRGYKGEHILSYERGDDYYKAQWFKQSRLNYADNILHLSQDMGGRTPSVMFVDEEDNKTLIEGEEFINQVIKCSAALRACGVKKGDIVAGWLPNCAHTIIAMLATARLGAVWSSCSPDFGVASLLDRFGQIEPVIIFTIDYYTYKGKKIDMTAAVAEVVEKLPTVKRAISVPFLTSVGNWDEFIKLGGDDMPSSVEVEFNHPLFVMFSSGTTGKPKCIVHSHGGVLLKHAVEHFFHTDLHPQDNLFYFTTCGWMMWNWMVSGLLNGSRLVLYDGNPFYPNPKRLLDLWRDEDIAVAGVSAKLIEGLNKQNISSQDEELKHLRMICSTGSALSVNSFNYVYEHIKRDVCLASISGGTDILGCFVMGVPTLPVRCGEIQAATLGMDTQVYDESGNKVVGQKGELVCCSPFPSVPVYFWGDDENKTSLHNAYFSRFPGIWAHGDYAEETESGGFIIYGRSDTTLNPGGVRIGTAEIYRQVEKVEEVLDSLAVGQEWGDDTRIVLFVVLRKGKGLENKGLENKILDDELKHKICNIIRKNTSPRHVPAKIIAVPDVPRTISGKISEQAVSCCIHSMPISNAGALANPECLSFFSDLSELTDQ